MSRSAQPRIRSSSLKAFQLEELLMLSAAPVPVDVIDPSLSADGGVVDVATVSTPMSGESTESILQAADVPQNESSVSSDSVDDLLQQFGLTGTSDESQQNLELVFIDEATDNYQQLVDDLLNQGDDQHRIEIILLDSEEDGILQISEALEDYINVDAVHIVSHGTEQSVKLGSTWLSLDNLDQFSESIAGWSDSFTPETDLLFYGCQLAENNSGQELLRQIQELTGADIAASTDDTGAANLGGDWDLEFELGELETDVIFSSLLQKEWLGLLATETTLDQFSTQSYGNNDGTQNWNGNWVEYDISGGSQSASNGDVRITGGELRMVGESGANHSVTREVDLSTAHDATLSFDASSSGTEAGDTFSVQISDDGGGSWTVLDVLEDYSGSYSKDISACLAADTQIRIQIDSGYDGGLLGILFVEYLYIDNVQVSYTVNNPPDITSDGGGAAAVVNVAENSTAVTTVTATDANLDTLNYAITGGADSGKFTINNSTGDLTFITAPDYESPTDNDTDNIYEVIVEASDGFGGTDPQTILVTVTPVNETPTAADNTVTTNEDTPYTFTVADFNFSDIDGDTLASVKITALETVGALQLSGADVTLNQVISRADIDAGNLTWTPVTNASGSSYDNFGFVVTDGALESSPSNTMTINVTAVNDAPTASDNTVTTSEDTPYIFTAADFNFSDIEGDTLASMQITSLETVGSLQLSGVDVTLNQVVTRADLDAGNFKFAPIANENGTSYDSFGFRVNDGITNSVASYTMTVDVTLVNDVPTAADKTVVMDEDTTYTFSVADFNFSDIDGDALASIQITSLETVGFLQLSGVDVTLNQVVSRADIDTGNLTFTPAANASGTSYDSFGFTVNDGTVDSVSAYTMTVDVNGTNDAPTAADNTVTTSEDTPYVFSAADFNFSDIDGDSLASVQVTSLESVGALQLSGVDVTLSQVVSRADLDAGNLTFTPVANENGTSYDGFGFRVNDGITNSVASYTMTVDVTAVNDAPTAGDKTVSTSEDTTYTFSVADFNFSDIDGDTLASIQITSLETVGFLQLSGVDVTLNQIITRADLDAGNLTFTPIANASGTGYVSFGFFVNDGTIDSVSSYVMTVDVTPVNDAPTAADNTVSTVENTTYTFTAADLGFSDIDGDSLASIEITTLESVGSLQLSGVDVTLNQVISKAELDAGNLTFRPVADTSGVAYDSFGFSVNDGSVDSAAAYVMTIDITPDPGHMILDQFNTQAYNNNDGTVNWSNDWVENDSSGGSQSPTNGDVQITGGELRMVGESGAYNSVTREADLSTAHDATLSFSAGSSGTESNDTFSVQISDDGGGSWTVLDVLTDFTGNYSRDISTWTAADTQVRIQIDTGYDGGLLGLLYVEDLYVNDVQISYTVNNPPVITSDGGGPAAVINVAENTTVVTTVAASDPDLDSVGYTIAGGTDAGLFTIDNTTGELAFISPPDYEGPLDSNTDNVYEVTVSASDAYGGSDSQTMLIAVTPVNEPPAAANSMVTASEDTTFTFTAADFNFSDGDGDSLASVTITSLESVGVLQLSGVDISLNQMISRADLDAGNLTFTPGLNANGTSYDSFAFSVNDGALGSTATYTMTVNVSSMNDVPAAADNLVTTSEDTPYVFSAADFNFSDLDGDPLASVRIRSLETVGALQLSGLDVTLNQVISRADIDAGNLTFTPAANASGTGYDSFGFSVSDGVLESTPSNTMTINVTAVNDPPTASDVTVITDEDTAYTFTAAVFNFSDVDGDSLGSVRISSLPAVGMLQLSGVDVTWDQIISRAEIDAGNLTYVPLADGNGVVYDSFGFVVSDGSLEATGASTVNVDVVPVNDAPVITYSGGGLNATVHVSGVLSTIATIEATDAESNVQVLTFSISGGLDADQFSIDASTGELSFALAIGLESVFGGGLNDLYEVTVQVSDGVGGTATQLLTVIVDQGNQSFSSVQQSSDDTGSTSDPDQTDQNDRSSDSTGADHNSGTGNKDLIFSSLPDDSDLFSQSQSRNAQANGAVLFASATPVDFSSLSQPLLDFTLETATENVVTNYDYKAGGGQSTRTALLRASIDPLRNSLEVHASEVVYPQLVWTRYDEIQEQVNLNGESDQLYVSTATVITTTVTSGLLIWALQGGYLMVGLASSLPAWRFMDPIAVLDEFGEDSDDEGDSLQSLIEQAETRTENQSADSDESEVV